MRIIHTSDWHLGRRFHATSLLDAQAAFADWFVDLAHDEDADLVVIAGDIYDRAIAPTEAIELFRSVVGRLLAAGVVVAAITGNHDAADRVAPYDELLDHSGFYLRGGYDRAGGVVTHRFDDGLLDLVLVPYLDPRAAPGTFVAEHLLDVDGDAGRDGLAPVGPPGRDGTGRGADDDGTAPVGAPDRDAHGDPVPGSAPGQGVAPAPVGAPDGDGSGGTSSDDRVEAIARARRGATHESVLAAVLGRARASLRSPRSLVVSHAFVAGGSTSDSERDLVIGGSGQVDMSLFDGFSYGALGHLHRPQQVAGSEVLRYSGTPLAYSFSEDHDKSVTVIDMDPTGGCTVRSVPVPVGRPVATIEGPMARLLDPSAFPEAHHAFVRAVVTDRETVLDARARLADVYPHVVEIHLVPDGIADTVADVVDTASRHPFDVVIEFWEHVEGALPDDATRDLLRTAVDVAVDTDRRSAPGGIVA